MNAIGKATQAEIDAAVGYLRELMEVLFEMVGLETVKAEIINTFKKVLRDQLLPVAARIPYTLNFAFLGASLLILRTLKHAS